MTETTVTDWKAAIIQTICYCNNRVSRAKNLSKKSFSPVIFCQGPDEDNLQETAEEACPCRSEDTNQTSSPRAEAMENKNTFA